jgi:hypothetical protein
MTAGAVGRPEFDRLAERVERIDTATARDVRGLAVNVGRIEADLSDVAEDVTEIKTGLAERDRGRVSGRRWLIGISIAALGAIGGLYPLVDMLANHH